jgi:hypothetical protein
MRSAYAGHSFWIKIFSLLFNYLQAFLRSEITVENGTLVAERNSATMHTPVILDPCFAWICRFFGF